MDNFHLLWKTSKLPLDILIVIFVDKFGYNYKKIVQDVVRDSMLPLQNLNFLLYTLCMQTHLSAQQFRAFTGGAKPKKEYSHEEDNLTIEVSHYLLELMAEGKVLEYSHIPHETYIRGWAGKTRNKRKGVRAGVPDMFIVFPKGVLFLELKRETGGVVSAAQKTWIAALRAVGGNVAVEVAAGWAEATDVIDKAILDLS